jgi:putative addiction module component (TIGR02574 family)
MKSENNLEDQVISLPHRDRARIALKLIESLEPGRDEDVSELWLDEAERRLAAYDAGETSARDADEVMAEVEQQIK